MNNSPIGHILESLNRTVHSDDVPQIALLSLAVVELTQLSKIAYIAAHVAPEAWEAAITAAEECTAKMH